VIVALPNRSPPVPPVVVEQQRCIKTRSTLGGSAQPSVSDKQSENHFAIPAVPVAQAQDLNVGNEASLQLQQVDVASLIRQEDATITEIKLEVQKIKKEAEERIQRLEQEICARESKLENWKEFCRLIKVDFDPDK